jgi:hypothetical protein
MISWPQMWAAFWVDHSQLLKTIWYYGDHDSHDLLCFGLGRTLASVYHLMDMLMGGNFGHHFYDLSR